MKRAYKIEINPTNEQKSKIHKTIGVSRFIYNFYIAHNKESYENSLKTKALIYVRRANFGIKAF